MKHLIFVKTIFIFIASCNNEVNVHSNRIFLTLWIDLRVNHGRFESHTINYWVD